MMSNCLHLLRHNSLISGSFLLFLFRKTFNVATVNLLHVVWNVLLMQIVLIKLREDFSNIINDQLWQLSIIVFNNEAKEFAIVIVDNIPNFFLKGKRCQLLPFELGIILANMHNIYFILYFECFVHFIWNYCWIQAWLCHIVTVILQLCRLWFSFFRYATHY